MFPGMPIQQGNKQERKLLKVFKLLDDTSKESLVSFAEFLLSKSEGHAESVDEGFIPTEPVDIPRPETESVIKAIKRLTKTFPMVDKEKILNPISGLMTSHILQGREAKDVIDDLEVLFLTEYQTSSL